MLSHLIVREKMDRLYPSAKRRERFLLKLRKFEANPGKSLDDEEVWTALFAYGFVADGSALASLASVLTERVQSAEPLACWIEMQPISPRRGRYGETESNSRIDLMLGDCRRRGKSVCGVEFGECATRETWVCMVEAKWLSDISSKTHHDPHRNQLARVAETAITFQGGGGWPARVHVTLLTPACFQHGDEGGGARLYGYKFHEYKRNTQTLAADIGKAKIERRNTRDFQYPNDFEGRMKIASLHWVTFESVFAAMPTSAYREELRSFVGQYGPLLELK